MARRSHGASLAVGGSSPGCSTLPADTYHDAALTVRRCASTTSGFVAKKRPPACSGTVFSHFVRMSPPLSTRIADFARDLKRRRVFRVTAWYVLAAWVLIQVAETTFPYMGLPPSAVSAVIGLTIAGLPVALVLSWVFDLTPEGLETTSRSSPTEAAGIEAPSDVLTIERAPPTPVTHIVGRGEEIGRADKMLRQEGVRLLTIVGAGGSGKTRLALELAHRLEEPGVFPDGVAWVPLDTVRDPELVAPAIGRALGFGESGDEGISRPSLPHSVVGASC